MPTPNNSLPDSMRQRIDHQINLGGFSTASEYMREVIRTDQRRKAQERIDSLLVKGLESGDAVEADEAFWKRQREALQKRTRQTRK